MTLNPAADSLSIFKDGKVKPGIYKIQNTVAGTFLDYEVHTRELLCRPADDLGGDKGLWEIKPSGPGHTIQRVEPGRPEQFCAPMVGLGNDKPISVSAYPVAWRIEVVNDDIFRGFEYVRFYWGTTKKLWNIPNGVSTRVGIWTETNFVPWFIWRLIPMKIEGKLTPSWSSSETPGLSSLPRYDHDGDGTGQSSARAQHAESERDDFGTTVTEVTVVTTRRRYRVEDT